MPMRTWKNLIINLDAEQHDAIKVAASQQRKSIKQFVLERLEPDLTPAHPGQREQQPSESASEAP